QLGSVEVVLARRGAVLERELERGARPVDSSQAQLGEAEPEVELVVIGRARHFLGVERACRAVVARLHRREPAVEVVERRLAFEPRSEEHTSELQSLAYLVCRLLLE